MPSSLSNGNAPKRDGGNASSSLEADIALLSNLLSQNVDESDPDVAEVLRRLEAAEGIADGVESRLDGIIDHLDNLLSDLEARATPEQGTDATQSSIVVEEVAVVSSSSPRPGNADEKNAS
ncbi:hypothetical protein GY45DRAFT_1326351 [Cubamyces sp. BRFM 1775]|nr:hypothetical protein GY45DRAFT_1326351 [Cubamyces sp. BRFM 1775]